MLTQASKSRQGTSLVNHLNELEVKAPLEFLAHLNEFSQECP